MAAEQDDAFCAAASACDAGIWWCGGDFAYFTTTVAFTGAWILVFYASAFLLFPLLRYKERCPSTDDSEEGRYWFANHVTSTIHALLISVLVVPAWIGLFSAAPDVQFMRLLPASTTPLIAQQVIISNAGMLFLSYILSDSLTGAVHGLHGAAMFVHHAVFAIIAVYIMYWCVFVWGTATFLMMETSTIFLNYLDFWRNRAGQSVILVQLAMFLFGLLYLTFRIFTLCSVTIYFGSLLWREEVNFKTCPRWTGDFLLSSMVAAFALQLFFFYDIVQQVCRMLGKGGAEGMNNNHLEEPLTAGSKVATTTLHTAQ